MTTRYFYAVFPDDDERDLTIAAADLMKDALQLRGRRIAGRRLHLTCHFIGISPERSIDLEARARAVGEGIDLPSFRIVFDRATSLGSDEVAPCVFTASVVPDALTTLHDHLRPAGTDAAMTLAQDASRTFLPHVTWLYSEDRVHGAMPVTPFAWSVRRIVLASRNDGDRNYRILNAWDLG